MRPIDADALKDKFDTPDYEFFSPIYIRDLIDAEPTIRPDEPRVMTLDLPDAEWEDKVIWLEIKDNKPRPCMLRECATRVMFGSRERMMYFDIIGHTFESGLMLKNYGVKWRCWTERPTDEQRKAVAWDHEAD